MKSIDKAMTNGHTKNMDKQPLLEAQKTPSVPKKEFQDLWRNQAGAKNLQEVAKVLCTPHRTVRHWHDNTRRIPGIAIAALNMWRELKQLRKLVKQISKTVELADNKPLGALARIDRLLADAKIERTPLDDHDGRQV